MISEYKMNLIMLICTLFATVYGAFRMLQKKRGKYYLNVFLGFLSFFLGRLFLFVYPLVGGSITRFSIGDLGTFSGFCFLICANGTLLPKMCDNSIKMSKLKSLIPVVLPVYEFIVGVVMLTYTAVYTFDWVLRISLVVVAPIVCSFFTLRAVIIPDVPDGFARCMRPFNIVLAVLTAQIPIFEFVKNQVGKTALWYVYFTFAVACVCIVIAMPMLERGYKKWIA